MAAAPTRSQVALLARHSSAHVAILLVANQNQRNANRRVLTHLVHPMLHVVEGGIIADVVDDQSGARVTIEAVKKWKIKFFRKTRKSSHFTFSQEKIWRRIFILIQNLQQSSALLKYTYAREHKNGVI